MLESVNEAPVISSIIIFKNNYSFIQFSYQYGHALLCTYSTALAIAFSVLHIVEQEVDEFTVDEKKRESV
jgi:hypothetical protein